MPCLQPACNVSTRLERIYQSQMTCDHIYLKASMQISTFNNLPLTLIVIFDFESNPNHNFTLNPNVYTSVRVIPLAFTKYQ